ncbi:ATP-grasp domain-containing protein [Halonatronum saccharophilum]|uniref:ATP-grasp domain-containing protein n=1 Tax=Halonatronum saccharophilum TaxID=150060 RepID=UPI000483AB6F|nr:ATP-grasp domain-containing protein [Halonatronum saccharophilum]
MIIIDKPYLSDLLKETIVDMEIPVLENQFMKGKEFAKRVNILTEEEFIREYEGTKDNLLYTNSENSLGWIGANISDENLHNNIEIFKDKVKFRELLEALYPDFYYQSVDYDYLEDLDIANIPKPFIVKPAVGFFSIGVHNVSSNEEWARVVKNIKEEMNSVKELYPQEVVSSTKFIIEEVIVGEEIAVDAYYNSEGQPVILNILEHSFSSDEDVSDRLYSTSKAIIEKYYDLTLDMLKKLGSLSNIKGLPLHIELRVDQENNSIPIEVNPMRFAGWCTTDIAYYAYGINTYDYYFKEKEVDWEKVFAGKEDKVFSIVVADMPDDVKRDRIKGIDYEGFFDNFTSILELRDIDWRKYPLLAFLFIETKEDNKEELDRVLKLDLGRYLKY